MEIDTGGLTGRGARNARGVCLRLSTKAAARLLAFGFLATFLIGFGIGFACVPAARLSGENATRFRATQTFPAALCAGGRPPLDVAPRCTHTPCAAFAPPLRRVTRLELR